MSPFYEWCTSKGKAGFLLRLCIQYDVDYEAIKHGLIEVPRDIEDAMCEGMTMAQKRALKRAVSASLPAYHFDATVLTCRQRSLAYHVHKRISKLSDDQCEDLAVTILCK